MLKHTSGVCAGLILATALGTGSAAFAETTTVLTNATTTGDMMEGMEIIVNFFDGTSQTSFWERTSPDGGGAFGSGWSLTQSGNTYFESWLFVNNSNTAVADLIINAYTGNTVFDIINGSTVTPRSGGGFPFTVTSGVAPSNHEYSVPIDISEGDLFGRLIISWYEGFTGDLGFRADTDSAVQVVLRDGSVPPIPSPPNSSTEPVPEPSTIIGSIGAIGLVRFLKQKTKRQSAPMEQGVNIGWTIT